MQQAALFSLCGVSSIVINHWSTTPEANFASFESLMRTSLADGIYVGSASARKHKPSGLIHKANSVTFGVPLMRVV